MSDFKQAASHSSFWRSDFILKSWWCDWRCTKVANSVYLRDLFFLDIFCQILPGSHWYSFISIWHDTQPLQWTSSMYKVWSVTSSLHSKTVYKCTLIKESLQCISRWCSLKRQRITWLLVCVRGRIFARLCSSSSSTELFFLASFSYFCFCFPAANSAVSIHSHHFHCVVFSKKAEPHMK